MFGAGAVIIGGAVVLAMIRLAGWREPESEDDFEAIVQRAERLAAEDALATRTTEYEPDDDDDLFDPHNEEDFKALVRSAIDELPLEFHRALEHVAIVVSDGGRRQRAYGLYQGDTVAQDYFHDRIVIFRDTLRARLRPRPRAAQGAGDAHRSPRARPPSRVGREGRPRPRPLARDRPSHRIARRTPMPEAVIVDAIRTPIGRAGQGLAEDRARRRPGGAADPHADRAKPGRRLRADQRRDDGRGLEHRRAGLQRRPQRLAARGPGPPRPRPARSTASAPPRCRRSGWRSTRSRPARATSTSPPASRRSRAPAWARG